MRAERGFALVTVLIVAAIGLLFGAGALLMFRFQCQRRIDRQHELEKVYAVRSVLSYVKERSVDVKDEINGQKFEYITWSERHLNLVARPVAAIFPNLENDRHFAMHEDRFLMGQPDQYNAIYDYEYGAIGATNIEHDAVIKADAKNFGCGLAFTDVTATNNVKWWVNIGMRDTGGWLQEDYGRRYYFSPRHYAGTDTENAGDVMRLCLIRDIKDGSKGSGAKHGWPLSHEGERAIVFQVRELRETESDSDVNAVMSLSECLYTGGIIVENSIIPERYCPSRVRMGVQIADDKICMFHIENAAGEGDTLSPAGGYDFSETVQMPFGLYKYFSEEVHIGGMTYSGIWTNEYGRVVAPDMRAVFEVEAAADKRKTGSISLDDCTYLTKFRVTPAYQYDIFLEHPSSVTNRATVAQKIGTSERKGPGYTVITYDTHGTDNKGFRKDEKDFAGRGSGR